MNEKIKKEVLELYLTNHYYNYEIMEMYNISTTTFYKIIKEYKNGKIN